MLYKKLLSHRGEHRQQGQHGVPSVARTQGHLPALYLAIISTSPSTRPTAFLSPIRFALCFYVFAALGICRRVRVPSVPLLRLCGLHSSCSHFSQERPGPRWTSQPLRSGVSTLDVVVLVPRAAQERADTVLLKSVLTSSSTLLSTLSPTFLSTVSSTASSP